jgi:hypothetical protein
MSQCRVSLLAGDMSRKNLIDELEHMDGNVGAVSQAITEVCTSSMTQQSMLMKLGYCATV